MKLYQYEACGYCRKVRQRLSDLLLPYESIPVPIPQHLRTEVLEVSGQHLVPVLVDGDVILTDENDIVAYLDKTYAAPK